MRTKSFILTFLMMMFCSISFGQNTNPDWGEFNYHDYAMNMEVIAKISLDGEAQTSTSIQVAAYCGNERRSEVMMIKQTPGGSLVQLQVFGVKGFPTDPNQTQTTEKITFKFYDGTSMFVSNEDMDFKGNHVVGDLFNPFTIEFKSVAKIGDVKYGSLQAAINAAQASDVIVLLANVVAETNPVNIPANVTLNLNAHTIKADIFGTVRTNNGLWITSDGYKMIGKDADIYASNDATVVNTLVNNVNTITIAAGDVTLAATQYNEWWTAQGQELIIGESVTFTIPQGKKFNIESNTSVTINGTVNNEGTLAIKNDATVKGNITGDIHFLGGKYITADNYNMVGTTSDYYYNTTDALVNIAGQFGDITIKSGEMTLGKSWRTVQGQTLTIASGAKFTVPANMTFEVFQNTHVIVNGTLVTDGTVYLQLNATVKAAEGLNVTTNVADHKVVYEDGVYKVVAKVYIAQTETGAKFETLQEAVNAGTTVTLLQPATGAGVVIDKDITIDFATYTYTVNRAVGSTGTETLGFQILKDNDVTLKNGKLTSTAVTSGKEVKMLVQNYADLTLTDMNLVDNTDHILYALSNNSGNVKLDGNTNITTDKVAFDVCKYASYTEPIVNVNTTGVIAGDIEVTTTQQTNLNISGGTFTVKIEEAWCANGFIPVKNADNTWTVKVGEYVARNTTTGQGYETLVEAVAAAAADQEVKLLANVTLASSLNVNRNVVLELNGYNIESGTIKAIVISNAQLTVNDSENKGVISAPQATLYVAENAKLIVNGGTIEGASAIQGNGSLNGTEVTINGGKIDGKDEIAIYHPQNGVLNIKGGTIVGSAGVEMRAGTLNMTAGTVVATGTFATRKHDSGQTVDGVAIALSQHTTNHDVDINITGGTIKSYANGKAFYQDRLTETYTPSTNITADIAATVEGAVEAAELGYNIVENNGVYSLVYVGFEAQIGEVKYETLVEAVEAAQPDATVILLKSATGAGVVIDKDITIDFATYTYTVNRAVGSTGTETLGFQILKDNDVTLKNGTLTSTTPVVTGKEVKMLIQNYANLTLTDMNLVENTTHIQYALSNNSGTSNINGATSITTDAVAFDVYDYTAGGYALPTVNVNTTGKITGAIEVSESISNNLNISGGLFTTAIAEAWCADGFFPTEVEIDGNTYYTVHEGLLGSGTETDPFIIRSLGELKFFRDHVNAGKTTYNAEGVHVALAANIDMATEDWSVNIGDDCNKTFDGIFDGKGYTISNLNGTETAQKTDGYVCTGLFGAIYGNAVIKNLTIENVNINTAEYTGNNAAAAVGFVYDDNGKTTTIENVTVKGDVNINASGVYGVGAIVGYSYEGGAVNIKNCKVVANEGSVITATSGTGAIIGYCAGRTTIDGCTVDNIDITGKGLVGGIAGITSISNTKNLTNNTVKNVNLAATKAEWVNSTAIAVGTMSGDGLTVANTIFENVNASRMVGSVYAEQPTYVVPAVEARIENKYYGTFDAALAAAQEGNTITVLVPIVITENKTYDLTGLTVVGENVYPIFRIQNNAEVTVKGEGTITNDDYVFVVGASDSSSAGNLTIESGVYTGTTTVASVTKGLLTIKGGEFKVNASEYGATYMINCIDANYNDDSANVEIYGGTFVGFDPENNAAEGAGTNFCAEGYLSVDNGDGTYTVRQGVYVAQVNDGAKYETLVEAVEAAQPDATVTLLQTATGAGVVIDKDITIDFGCYTYSFNEGVGSGSLTSNGFQLLGGNVVLKNGTLKVADADASEFYILVQNYTNLTVENMTLDGTNLDKWSKVQDNWDSYTLSNNSGEVYIKGSTIIVNNDGVKSFAFDVDDNANYTSKPVVYVANLEDRETLIQGQIEVDLPNNLNISGGLFTVEIEEAWCADGYIPTQTEDSKWTVKLGEYVARVNGQGYETFDAALAADGEVIVIKPIVITEDKEYNFTNEKITGDNVYPIFRIQNGATMIVTGGEVTNPTDYVFVLGASDGSSHGDLIINGGKYHGATTVASVTLGALTITGGEFSVEPYEGNYAFLINCIDANYKNGTASVAITGGTFHNWNPQNNAAEGTGTDFCYVDHAATETAENVWTVLPAVAKIGEARFATLQDAVNAAQANETINLIANVQLTKFVTIDKSVNLNLGQFDITRNDVPLYIKKLYQDEPSFRDTKVVFSLFSNDLKSNLQPDIIDKIMLKDIKRSDLEEILSTSATYNDLCKLAISYSDGIIQNSKDIDPTLLDFAREKNIPILGYQNEESYAEECNKFYDEIYSQNELKQ